MPNKQAGVSLVLAVLILSAITAIAFSLATIVFIEIRSSGDVVRTEPNLYASFGLTEEGLLQFKRSVSATDMDITQCGQKYDSVIPGVCSINNVSLSLPKVNGANQPIQYDESPAVKVIYGGTKIEIPMYQPNDYTQQYSKVQLDLLPGATNSLKVAFRKTNSSGVVTYDPPSYPTKGDTYNVAVNTPFIYNSFDTTNEFDMILDNSTAGNKDVSVSISTFDPFITTVAKGLPFIGQDVLKIVADYLGLTRTYKVQIPLLSSSGDITNVAAASSGATAQAYYSDQVTPGNSHSSGCFPVSTLINGDRTGTGWGTCGNLSAAGWNDDGAANPPSPDYVVVSFSSTKTINEIDVFTIQDTYWAPSTPTPSMTFNNYGVTAFTLQYWNGSSWIDIPGASVSGNKLVWRTFSFAPISTTKFRIKITGTADGTARLIELEAYGF